MCFEIRTNLVPSFKLNFYKLYKFIIKYSSQVFTSIALLNMLIAPLNAFPWVLNGLTEAWVSVKRIEKLLEVNMCAVTVILPLLLLLYFCRYFIGLFINYY